MQWFRYVSSCICQKYKAFCRSRWSCANSDEVSQVMLLESASVATEDYKFESVKNLGV